MSSAWLNNMPEFLRKRLQDRHELQEILTNSGWLFGDKIVRMGIGLFIGVWIARYLGPEQYGSFNFALAFVALFGTLASLGLDGIVVRDIVREPERRYEILSSAFVLKLCGGCLVFLISLIAILIMRPEDNQAHWLVGIIAAGLIFQSFDTIDLWFQSQLQSKYTVLAKNGAFIILSVIRGGLILNSAFLVAFAYAALAEIIIGAAGLLMFYLKQQVVLSWCPRKDTSRRLLGESWPVILSCLAIMVYIRIDQIMLAQLVGNHAVGVYSAAVRFSEIWYFIPSVIVSSVMPVLTQVRQESEKIYLQRIQQLLNNLVRIAYAIALPMTFIATFLITSFYGQAYAEAGTILAIHIWTAVFVFLGMGMSPWLLNEGLLKYSIFQTVTGALVNICLNIFLIPRYGGVGAAIATLISQIIASFASNITVPGLRVIFKMQLRALLRPL